MEKSDVRATEASVDLEDFPAPLNPLKWTSVCWRTIMIPRQCNRNQLN